MNTLRPAARSGVSVLALVLIGGALALAPAADAATSTGLTAAVAHATKVDPAKHHKQKHHKQKHRRKRYGGPPKDNPAAPDTPTTPSTGGGTSPGGGTPGNPPSGSGTGPADPGGATPPPLPKAGTPSAPHGVTAPRTG